MRTKADSEKIIALDKLAEYYFIYKLNAKADSVLQDELQRAEVSNNPNLKFTALFGNAILNKNIFATSESFEKSVAFLKDGIEYATSQNNYEYIGLGYCRLSYIFRQRGIIDTALQNAKMAIESLYYITNDSVKSLIYIELGKAYAAKGDMVPAVKNYNIAFDYALNYKSIPLQSEVYHDISEIYSSLNHDKEAEQELLKSFELNKENNNRKGLLKDYYDLARVTNNILYINKALEEARALDDPLYIISSKILMLWYIAITENNSDKALSYLKNETDLFRYYQNAGASIYNINLANIYLYGGNADSALKYFKLSENDIINSYDEELIEDALNGTATAYQKLHDWPNAISYFTKVFERYKKQRKITSMAEVSDSLGLLYNQIGNYKAAFKYSNQAIQFNNDLKKQSGENDVALLGVRRENRLHEEELKIHEMKMNRQMNIQYMFISISICIVFLVLLVLGAFSVSKLTIKLGGYFFFISVFEFIVMLIDNSFFNKAVHYEPLKLWFIKIGLIACLVPIQHFMEQNLIKFLQSRKLLEARKKFSIKRIWENLFRKSGNKEGEEIEEDTAVL